MHSLASSGSKEDELASVYAEVGGVAEVIVTITERG